ncbi:MAG TPA: tetratricopeptide repeat protein [Kofleriaceae bacterium]|nr:tetratricopeptide repeat protein [Kofleriaceae bacterium]
MKRALLLAFVLAASTAQANVWERAIDADQPERLADDKFESEMRQGDEHALLASSRNIGKKEVFSHLQNAIAAYRNAAAAKPRDGEPYFRIGKLLYAFYFDCTDQWARTIAFQTCTDQQRDPKSFNVAKAKEIIAAWDAFEARAPLDPRLSVEVSGDTEILFDRAILHTKLATKADLEAAALDYEKLLSRHDGLEGGTGRVLGNLAETYMMLGRMEESLETYREALRAYPDTSTLYGYAVALDRDESTRAALDIIKSSGLDQRRAFYEGVQTGGTFFVPEGEVFYYLALVDEAFGYEEDAIGKWQAYIASGAHPEFQPRAKAHLDTLNAHKRRRAIPIESPWPDLFR